MEFNSLETTRLVRGLGSCGAPQLRSCRLGARRHWLRPFLKVPPSSSDPTPAARASPSNRGWRHFLPFKLGVGGAHSGMAAAEPGSTGQATQQGQGQNHRPTPSSPAPPSQVGGPAGGSSRHEKSLGLLTAKFVSLLQEAQDGVLDLKAVSTPPRDAGGGGRTGGRAGGRDAGQEPDPPRGHSPARNLQRALSRASGPRPEVTAVGTRWFPWAVLMATVPALFKTKTKAI